jgi:hypothetical protein
MAGDLVTSLLIKEATAARTAKYKHEPTHEPLPPGVECVRPDCNVCPPPPPWYGLGVEECCASGRCEVCSPGFGAVTPDDQ